MNCKNCDFELKSDVNFCSQCGHPVKLKRIDFHYIVHEIEHVLHFERGILFTIKELFIRPGQNIKTYLSENRSRLIKPIIFIIVTSLIYTITNNFFQIDESYVKFSSDDPSQKVNDLTAFKIFKWIQGHYGYANILMAIFIAFWLKLLFKKHEYNFFEILILLCFIMGIGMLIYALFAIVQGITNFDLMSIGGIVGVIYSCWAIGNFYGKNTFTIYLKALVSYLFGMLSFLISAIGIGFFIDFLTK